MLAKPLAFLAPFAFVALVAAHAHPARAQDACPSQAVSDRFVCFDTGDIAEPANRTTLVYTPSRAFVAGSEICAFVDVSAELEEGGWDQVFLRFSAGTDPAGTTSFVDHCLAGDAPLSCESNLSPGCESLPTVTHDVAGTFCWQPPAGTTTVAISVYVKTLDGQFQCGDCLSGGSPGVTVSRLEVTGCNGFPPVSTCGDGTVDPAETCDDGNTVGRDGCSAACLIEPGAICNDQRTRCSAAGACGAITPGALAIDYCYENGDALGDSPLEFTWRIASQGDPLDLAYDIAGGLEIFSPDFEPFAYDQLWLSWEDDAGGFDLVPLNVGQGMTEEVAYEVYSRGVFRITPAPGATRVTASFFVEADGSFSCAQDPELLQPLSLASLTLASTCAEVVTSYDSFNAFTSALPRRGCYSVIDFNARPDGELGPFFGDGFIADTDSPEGIALSVEAAPYPSTFASGDGTPALDPQIPEWYASNSRLRVDFAPRPARAIGMTFIDVGDIDGVMGLEAYRNGRLVHFDPDIQVGSPDNNHIAWRGFIFDQPVDAVVFSMLQPADHFNLDNLVIVPQADADDDGIPDLCDCAPTDPDVAGDFRELCDDLVDNDCDGHTDAEDGDCGGAGTATCSTYAEVLLDADNGGWLVSGDTAWGWASAAGDGRWSATSANNLAAVLETAPLRIPAGACPGDFKIDLALGGVVSADGDALVIAWAKNGGAFTTWKSLTGTLSPDTLDLTGAVVPGDLVSLRLTYQTNASGTASGPTITSLRLYSDEDGDLDGVCDGCDCAPANADYGSECDQDGDGWCAEDTGPLNANPLYAGCDNELAGGNPQISGSDCDDEAATASPSNATEDPFCGDQLDNDCDGLTDQDDPDCAAPTCTDPDGDGYGTGDGCLGPDCLEGLASCNTDCTDRDDDGVPECNPADTCVDLDGDGYGQGAGCRGPDCNESEPRCAVDCDTDLDSDRIPDCAETCVDADGDGYGSGPGCVGLDCDDTSAQCTVNCADSDSDQVPDCRDGCLDADRDGHGQGPACAGPDCDESRATCTTNCADNNANGTPDCGETCQDADGDGYGIGSGCLGPDCAEGVAACNVLCRDVDGDQLFDCDPRDDCIDKDDDGHGQGPGCLAADCDDNVASCTTSCVDSDRDQRLDCDPADTCIDADRDGFGVGPGCNGPDCDDTVVTCASDCVTDVDGDQVPDCAQSCIDADGDDYGVGPGCRGADCDDTQATCNTSCVDTDMDRVWDCADPCLDSDGDGYGLGQGCTAPDCDDDRAACNTSCADANANGTPDCAEDCVDQDRDGYGLGSTCIGADCDDARASCTTECVDRDTDGVFDCADGCLDVDRDGFGVGPDCAGADCDDALRTCTIDCSDRNGNDLPDCNEGCRDQDGDGFGVGADCTEVDCDDRYPVCTTQCTHSDQDGIPDCADEDDDQDGLLDIDEGNRGTNPLDPDSDDDGLLDGAEVNQYGTDPTNADTDGDGLKDGEEVTFHATSPTNPDTDGGGVSDGVEVQRGTSPLDPADDDLAPGDGRYEGGGGCTGGSGHGATWLALLALAFLTSWRVRGRRTFIHTRPPR